ncbi:MAG TPA: hypothetical protein VEU47_18940, partial [Candidatus Cybelea sp.]|nr:hypothetical protein [Candidatus Cybelea sp.]
ALEHLRRAIGINPREALSHFYIAAALALTGHMAEAEAARDAGLRLDPNFSVVRIRDDRRGNDPVHLQQRERLYEGMRKAGVPEGE